MHEIILIKYLQYFCMRSYGSEKTYRGPVFKGWEKRPRSHPSTLDLAPRKAAPYPLAQGRAGRPGTLAMSPAHRATRVRRAAYQAVVCSLRVAGAKQLSTRPATPTRPRRSCETPYAAGPRRWTEA